MNDRSKDPLNRGMASLLTRIPWHLRMRTSIIFRYASTAALSYSVPDGCERNVRLCRLNCQSLHVGLDHPTPQTRDPLLCLTTIVECRTSAVVQHVARRLASLTMQASRE